MSVFIAHIKVAAADGTPESIYVSDEPVRPISSGDVDAPNRIYEPILIEPANVRRDIFGNLASGGGERGYGVMKLSNAGGELSVYKTYSFSDLEILRYEPGTALSTALPLFRGVVSKVSWTHPARATAQLVLNLRDDFAQLETEVQTDRYAGTASGGHVLEGEDSLASQGRPLLMGDLSSGHVPGVLVSPGQQIWQVNSGAIVSVDAVYDRGDDAGYSNDGDLSEAAFLVATPGVDRYVTHLARGLIKMGGSPVGRVGFSITETTAATPRALIKRLLLGAGISAGNISADFDEPSGPSVGVFLKSDMNISALIRFIARAETAACAPDNAGVWRYSPLATPKVSADYNLEYDHILDLTPDGNNPLPAHKVSIGYGRIHQNLSRGDMAPAILGTSAETIMGEEWRYAVASDSDILVRWSGAQETRILTPIRETVDAQNLADDLLDLLGPRGGGGAREQLRLVMPLDAERAVLALGSTVHVDYPPAGIDRNFVLTGTELTRPKPQQMIWRVWG